MVLSHAVAHPNLDFLLAPTQWRLVGLDDLPSDRGIELLLPRDGLNLETSDDTPENREVARGALERWDSPATVTLEEVIEERGLHPQTGKPKRTRELKDETDQ